MRQAYPGLERIWQVLSVWQVCPGLVCEASVTRPSTDLAGPVCVASVSRPSTVEKVDGGFDAVWR